MNVNEWCMKSIDKKNHYTKEKDLKKLKKYLRRAVKILVIKL